MAKGKPLQISSQMFIQWMEYMSYLTSSISDKPDKTYIRQVDELWSTVKLASGFPFPPSMTLFGFHI